MKNPHKMVEEDSSHVKAQERSLRRSVSPSPLCRLTLALLPPVSGSNRAWRRWAEMSPCRLMSAGAVVPSWVVPGTEYHLQGKEAEHLAQHGFRWWEPLDEQALFSPGQPGSQNLSVDADLRMPRGSSLPASIAPKDYFKPALFRNKGTVCMTQSHGARLAWPRKKPWGRNNKSNDGTGRGSYACREDLGTGQGCSRGPWGHRHWRRARRDGENAARNGGLGWGSFPKSTLLLRLVQPGVSHLARLARFPGLGCKNSLG